MNVRKQNVLRSLFIMGVLLFSGTSFVFGASQLTKTYNFHAKSEVDLNYDVPKTIKEGGKEYELIDVIYRINKEDTREIIKTVKSKDKVNFPKTIVEKVNGEDLTLYAAPDEDGIDWKQSAGEIRIQEYKSRNDIPQTISSTKTDADGNNMDIVLELTDMESFIRTESFKAPAKFYSPIQDGTVYMFNGKKVTIIGGLPIWSSYKADVKDYLDLNGNAYSITDGSWTSAPVKQGDQYVRTATFNGTKNVPIYKVTFTETADSATYTADITYKYIAAQAIATYEPVTDIAKIVAIGAGIVVIAAIIIGILYFIAKRRKATEE